jgi:putative endonuclease
MQAQSWVPVTVCRETGMTTWGGASVDGDRTYWVYILARKRQGTLYVGVTNSLERRIAEHKAGDAAGFTKRYGVDRLVFYRGFGEVTAAIHFEKQLKRWRRDWKVRLIEAENPEWTDLYIEMMELPPLHPDLAAALKPSPKPVIPVLAQPKTGTDRAQ